MAVERKFVEDSLKRVQVKEYLAKELDSAGFGGVQINRTPLGTQVIVYAERPGLIIGRGGRRIKKLTRDLEEVYGMDNPQIDVREIDNPDLNPQLMASNLARALERGWYFRRAGHTVLNRIMAAGALGCEIIISGKLTGPRSRTEKMIAGKMKHAGQPAEDIVLEGYAIAIKKLGALGVKVRIIPPDAELPDSFEIMDVKKEEETEKTKETVETVETVEPSQEDTEKEKVDEKKSVKAEAAQKKEVKEEISGDEDGDTESQ
jgi:small subunit ribosomal protein S3